MILFSIIWLESKNKEMEGHLPKANPCAYHNIFVNKVLCVPLGLVNVRVSTEPWPKHPKLKRKKEEEEGEHLFLIFDILYSLHLTFSLNFKRKF